MSQKPIAEPFESPTLHAIMLLLTTQELEPMDMEEKDDVKELAEQIIDDTKVEMGEEYSDLLIFNIAHRMKTLASEIRELVYDQASEELAELLEEGENSTSLFGTGYILKTKQDYVFKNNPKLTQFEQEKEKLEEEYEDVIKKHEQFKSKIKSLDKQIKTEKESMVEQGEAIPKGEPKRTITLKY